MEDQGTHKEDEILELQQEFERIMRENNVGRLTQQEKEDKIIQDIEDGYERVKSYFDELVQNGLEQEMIQIGLNFFEWIETEIIRLKKDTESEYLMRIVCFGVLTTEINIFREFLEKIKEKQRDSLYYI